MLALSGLACTSVAPREEGSLPQVTLTKTPPAVRAAIEAAAAGSRIQKINSGHRFEGRVYQVYLAATPGPRLLTVSPTGAILEDGAVIPFSEMPPAVQAAAREAVSAPWQVCRKSLTHPQPRYLIDYLIGKDEPVFAIIEADGFIRAVFGYADDDPD